MKKLLLFLSFIIGLSSNLIAQNCLADFQFSSNNLTVTFTDSSFYSPNVISPIQDWDFGDGNIGSGTNPVHIYTTAGTYTACLTISDTSFTCFDTICKMVIVTGSTPPTPCMAGFTYSTNPNNNVAFFSTITGGTAPYVYNWNFGDGTPNISTTGNPTHTYANLGAYTVDLTISDANGTTCSFSDTINVNNTCFANFSYSFIRNGVVNFSNLSNPIGTGVNFNWDFGDGSFNNVTNPIHSYSSLGDYPVILSMFDSTNNCSAQIIDTISIISTSNCRASFSNTINNDTLFVQNLASNYTSLFYNFGDSTTSTPGIENPSHIYQNSGNYIVCQTVIDTISNCIDTRCDTINITLPPNCNAKFSTNTNGLIVDVMNQASNYDNIYYDFGDGTGSSSANPSHQYISNGSYIICQTVSTQSGCSDTFCDTVLINVTPPCQAGFTVQVNSFTASFSDTAINYDSIHYDFGDGIGSSLANPSHQYISNGSYIICQTISNQSGCSDIFCDTITINVTPPCEADFTFQTINDTTYFSNLSSNYDQLLFNFGDGFNSTDTNPIHEYTASGSYTVTLVVYNTSTNCVDSISKNISVTISASCVAKYELALDTNQRDILFLVNTSSSDNTHEYFWDFGDGNTSTLRLPNHQYSLNKAYNICLTVFDTVQNCTSTYCDSVGLDSNGNILKSAGFKLKVLNGTFIGIEENYFENSVSIFPNPFNNFVNVEVENFDLMIYSLFNAQGAIVKEGRLNSGINKIETESIERGIYFLRLNNANQTTVKQIIKM